MCCWYCASCAARRDLNGSIDSFEAYYDTGLNITWLADANYAKTSGYDSDGLMTWEVANTWAEQLNINGYKNWRLPTVTDSGASGCQFAYAGTDCGYSVNTATGEMAHLFYSELGNKAYYDTAGVGLQAGWGLTNTGPFTNLHADYYWSGTEYAPNTVHAWDFRFYNGAQDADGKPNDYYAWAGSPGDVGIAAVPETDTWAMMLVGLGLVGAAAGRRRR